MSLRRALQLVGLLVAGVVAGRRGRFGRRAAMRAGLGAAIGGLVSPNRSLGALSAAAGGASVEVPVLGAPLALATLAAASPTFADAATMVAGAGIGLATTRVWPVAPRTVEELREYGTKRHVHASTDGAGVSVLVNTDQEVLDAIGERFPAAKVIVAGDNVDGALRDAASSASVALGAAGGDGTVSASAALAYENGLPLIVVPAGTLNHFARDLGLLDVDDAFDAVAKGEVIEVDLATVDDRVFVNTASFGAYTDLVEAREKLEDRIGKWPAVALALIGVLRRAEPLHLRVDGRNRRLWLGFIGNGRYHPSGFAPTWRRVLDDGQLDIRLVDAEQPFARTRLVLSVLTGRLGRSTIYEQRCAPTVELSSDDGPIAIALDGEVCEVASAVTVAKLPRPLSVFAPHR